MRRMTKPLVLRKNAYYMKDLLGATIKARSLCASTKKWLLTTVKYAAFGRSYRSTERRVSLQIILRVLTILVDMRNCGREENAKKWLRWSLDSCIRAANENM